jgi:XTP/dITP diphosphohydrolase
MISILIATRNGHKVEEIRAILGGRFVCSSLANFCDVPEVQEDAATFAGNATKKAVELAKWLSSRFLSSEKNTLPKEDCFILADDSGLEVDALGGAPGVNSARFAALDTGKPGNSATSENNAKLLRLLRDVPADKRAARFKCVLALTPVVQPQAAGSSPVCFADDSEFQTQLFEGICEGRIGFELRGVGGFGYDPLFFPEGYDQTFGELSAAIKNHLSHRARALESLSKTLL